MESSAKGVSEASDDADNWVARRTIPCIAVSPRMHLFDLEEVKAALREKYGVSATDR